MPIRRTLSSVKKAASAHPESRKACQIKRALLRNDKLAARLSHSASSKQHPLVDKLTWFQLQLDESCSCLTADQADAFIQEYIDRHAGEMARIRAEQRAGRPTPPRLSMLEKITQHEAKEHQQGQFEMVDLLSPVSVAAFKRWSGDYNAIPLLKLVRYKKK